MLSVQTIKLHYNTVYAIGTADGLVLIDTGPDYRGAWKEIRAAIPELPVAVVATHGHIDHASLGRRWQEEGVPVLVGRDDAPLVRLPALHRQGEMAAMEAYVESSGAPPEMAAEMIAGLRRRHAWAARAASDDYPPGGSSNHWPSPLRFAQYQPDRAAEDAELPGGLEVVACPGHTPGNLVVVQREEGWLFSGDQLLPGITPTPAVQATADEHAGEWRFRSLPAFYESLSALEHLGLQRCFPGHGEPFHDAGGAIRANLDAIDARSSKVHDALREHRPSSPWSLCELLYRRAALRRPWQLLSTIQGHLDLLEHRGAAHETPEGWAPKV